MKIIIKNVNACSLQKIHLRNKCSIKTNGRLTIIVKTGNAKIADRVFQFNVSLNETK